MARHTESALRAKEEELGAVEGRLRCATVYVCVSEGALFPCLFVAVMVSGGCVCEFK